MLSNYYRNTIALASIFSFRMLGLFMVLPVLALYLKQLEGASSGLIGLALGIYGLFQAMLQIPLGMLSDRYGRKLIIACGLIVFVLGSVIAAMAGSIYGIILGRALQGAGAVGSSILALMADVTPAEKRSQAMAIIGMMIGLSFFIAMLVGPMVNHWFQLSGIFWLTAILGLIGLLVLAASVPTPAKHPFHQEVEAAPGLFKTVLQNRELLKLDWGIGTLHAVMTGLFVALPLILRHDINLDSESQIYFYLPVLVPAFIAMLPFIIIAEKKRLMKPVFKGMVSLMLVSQLLIGLLNDSIIAVAIGLFAFFTAFSAMEALLPSLVSKQSPAASKGTAMGVYSACQFMGIFVGGVAGGYSMQHWGFTGLFALLTALLGIWLVIASTMQQPFYGERAGE